MNIFSVKALKEGKFSKDQLISINDKLQNLKGEQYFKFYKISISVVTLKLGTVRPSGLR